MSQFTVLDTTIPAVKLIERKLLGDERGFLTRLFCAEELLGAGWDEPIAQINHTYTSKPGTVRGMHFQHPPFAETKLVTCLRGAIFDVAVDLRKGSGTFLHWYAAQLSADNHRAMLIPRGFAHGFQTLAADCELVYLHSARYAPGSEGAVNALDPRLRISWPLAVGEQSARDQGHALLTEDFQGILV